MVEYTYVNGQLLPSKDASLHVQDRGFRFGDGAFETIKLFNGKPYQLALHQQRLDTALKALHISHSVDLEQIAQALLAESSLKEGFLRVAVSRGVGSKGYHSTAEAPTIVAECIGKRETPTKPATLALSKWRKIPGHFLPANSKLNASGLNSSLATLEAQQMGADEALQQDQNGCISEASSGNIFWITGDILYTPSLDCDCLDGTTRAAIMRLSHLPIKEVTAPISQLESADAVFMSNCAVGVWAISKLLPFDWHWPDEHPHINTLKQAYDNDLRQHCA